jgi:hypothetical protein
MFTSGFFWFVMGMLMVLVGVGAAAWVKDLGLKMTWWKWLLAILWYALLNLSVAVPMTFVGENEPGAAVRTFLPLVVITIITGVGLWRVLAAGRQMSVSE